MGNVLEGVLLTRSSQLPFLEEGGNLFLALLDLPVFQSTMKSCSEVAIDLEACVQSGPGASDSFLKELVSPSFPNVLWLINCMGNEVC